MSLGFVNFNASVPTFLTTAVALSLLACGPEPGSTGGGEDGTGDGGESTSAGSMGDATGGADESAGDTGGIDDGSDGSSGDDGDEPPTEVDPICGADVPLDVRVNPTFHPDVDGDGTEELWVVLGWYADDAAPPFELEGYAIADDAAELVVESEHDGTAFAFADVDGDGRDDLVSLSTTGPTWSAGAPDMTIAAPEPIDLAGPWTPAFADADGDGDDDLFRLVGDGPVSLEVAFANGGTYGNPTSLALPGHIAADAELVSARALPSGAVLLELSRETEDGSTELAVTLVSATDRGLVSVASPNEWMIADLIGAVDGDGSGLEEVYVGALDGESFNIVALSAVDGILVDDVLLENATNGALGDFEGSGGPQMLFRWEPEDPERDELWSVGLYRFGDHTVSAVNVGDLWGFPFMSHGVDYDGDGVDQAYAYGCDLGCWAMLVTLFPC